MSVCWIRASVLALSAAAMACDPLEGEPIGPEGGIVVSDDGHLTLDVPAGALDEVVGISILPVDVESTTAAYAIEPLGTTLVLPAHVEFERAPPGIPPGAVLVLERGPRWRALADRSIDTDAGVISGSTNVLGVIAVVE